MPRKPTKKDTKPRGRRAKKKEKITVKTKDLEAPPQEPQTPKEVREKAWKVGLQLILFAGFIMWIVYSFGLEVAILFNNLDPLQLAKVLLIVVNLKYLFYPMYVLGSKFMELTGANVLAEAYRDEIKKAWKA